MKGPIECLQASMSMESSSAGPVASDDGQTLSKPSPSTPKSSAGRPVAKETKQRRGGRPAEAKRRAPPQRSAANDAAVPYFRNRRGIIGYKAGSWAGRRKRGGLELVWSFAVAALAVMCIMAATVMLEPHSLVENDFSVKMHRILNGGTHVDIDTETCVVEDVASLIDAGAGITEESKEDIVRPYFDTRNDSSAVARMQMAVVPHAESKLQLVGLNSFFPALAPLIAVVIMDCSTALLLASFNGHAVNVRLILAACGTVDPAFKYGYTPLFIAAGKGHIAVTDRLILAGADIEKMAEQGVKPLHIACANGNSEVVGRLIAAHADVNALADDGVTPLMFASFNGHPKVVARLLAARAAVDSAQKDGVTALYAAAINGHASVARMLITAGANVHIQAGESGTPLFAASVKGHLEVMDMLIAAGADVNAETPSGWTPLHFASLHGCVEAVELLLGAQANVNATSKEGASTVAPATEHTTNRKGISALSIASHKGHLDVVVRLLRARAHVNTVDFDQRTPLHKAAYVGHDSVVRVLLAAGADARARDSEGNTPADLARRQGHRAVEGLLVTVTAV